ncbi:MAG: helix-turn-helix domain-containing protein [Polyangiaceae bacterium]
MRKAQPGTVRYLVRVARHTLGMTQAKFGPALGMSHRSAVRWERGYAAPPDFSLAKLAALLAPRDLELAAEAAGFAGGTLESLGIVAPAAPVAPAAAPAAPAMPEVSLDDRVALVVLAAAEATDATPNSARALLHAAVARAITLGLSVEQLEASLRVRVAAPGKKDAAKGAGAATEPAVASPHVRVATKTTTEEAEPDATSTQSRRARAH